MARQRTKTEKKSIRFSPEMVKVIERRAAIENKTFSEIIIDACHRYLVREEEVEEKWDIILRRLVRMTTETKRLKEDVRIAIAATDGLARYFFAQLPEIPATERESANLASARRHKNYVRFILDHLRQGGDLVEMIREEEKKE